MHRQFCLSTSQNNRDNNFLAGKVGEWIEHLSNEQSAYIDKLCQNYLTPAGIEPQFELGGKKDEKKEAQK